MPDLADLYPGFASHWIDTAAGRIFARSGGKGPPLLLLHGYPQTNVMWHRVAPALAAHFSLIIPDLPGYGWSDAPPSDATHAPYTKRAMAAVMIEAMEAQVDRAVDELMARFPDLPAPDAAQGVDPFDPQTLVEPRETNQSHLRMIYRPALDPSDAAERASFDVYATLLGGSMGSRLFDEIREQRGLAYSVSASSHAASDVSALLIGAGLDSTKCVEAYSRSLVLIWTPGRESSTSRPRRRQNAAG